MKKLKFTKNYYDTLSVETIDFFSVTVSTVDLLQAIKDKHIAKAKPADKKILIFFFIINTSCLSAI